MRLSASGNRLTLTSPDRLVSGSINVFSCYFDFDSSWDGYFPTAVFESTLRAKKVEQAVIDGECLFPFELLDAGARVRVGIYGVNGDKRRPTTYAEWMPVAKGTETGGSAETPPDPTVYESILAAITDGRLVGPPGPEGPPGPAGPDGYSPTVALTETESGVRVSVQNKDNVQSATVLNGKDGAPGKDGVGIQSVTQTTTSTEDGGTNIVTVTKTDGTTSTFEVRNGGGGTSDHAKLKNRDAADQHPMSAITGLEDALAGKQPVGDYLTEERDPTVPEWAKQPQKPAYTASDVNAEPSGAVAQHNVSDAAHSDIRLLIQGLSERLSAVADSDDTTLDQMSEIVAYIKSNKNLIDAITTSKVNVSDIVDNLTTNVANKPLSAAQGVAIKAIIDALTIPTALSDLTEDTTHRVVTDAEKAVWNAKSNFSGSYNDLTDKPTIPAPYTLPIASATQLGGVKPVTKTDAMTQSVGVDEAGALWAPPGSGGGSSQWKIIRDLTITENVDRVDISTDDGGNAFSLHEIHVFSYTQSYVDSAENYVFLMNGYWGSTDPYISSGFKSTKSSDTYKQSNHFIAMMQNGIADVFQPWVAYIFNNKNAGNMFSIGDKYQAIENVSFVGKFISGCRFVLVGRVG